MAKEVQTKNFDYDLFNLIKFAWDRKRILITLTLAAFVISIFVSLMIKPRFKSKVILFPTAEISVSKSLVETSVGSNNEKDVLTFGNDIEAERLLQILRSDQLYNHLITKFDLMKYYDAASSKYPNTYVKGILGSNIKSKRTEYNSIEILVLDHNKEMAADIANEIAVYADTIVCNVTNTRAKQAYEIVLEEYNTSQQNLKNLTDSLTVIRSYGITDYERQAEALNKVYANAIVKGDVSAMNAISRS